MKYFLLFLGFIVPLFNSEETLNAVSSFHGLEELHVRVRNRQVDSNLKHLFKTSWQSRICEEVLSSGYFKRLRIRMVYSYVPRFKLYSYVPLFDRWGNRLINVYNRAIDEYLTENVFFCRGETISPTQYEVIKYFISQEYNVSDASSNQYIAGRFVFRREGDKIQYDALAEEPAKVVEQDKNVEQLYLETRKQLAESASDDPLCKLDIQKRLRICTIVMSSSYFVINQFEFKSSTDYVSKGCRKRRITFRSDYARTRVLGKVYEEWMFACQAKKFPETVDFYLSRAYDSHKLFVYATEENTGRNFLEVLTTNVRYVIDKMALDAVEYCISDTDCYCRAVDFMRAKKPTV